MALGELLCPIDGLLLGKLDIHVKPDTDVSKDSAVGGHIHMEVDETLTCLGGHTWRIQDSLFMERVS
jgi:hypothetical protein